MNEQWASTTTACSKLGVSGNTLRSWADRGLIPCKYTVGGHRRFNINKLDNDTKKTADHRRTSGASQTNQTESRGSRTTSGRKAVYCRVSSTKQRDDLQRQVAAMQEKYPTHEIYQDIGSGLNYKRKALKRLLGLVQSGDIKEVVVAHRDRLARFGVDLIEWIITSAGASLIILDTNHRHQPGSSAELTEDLLAVVHVFSCRLNGKRRYLQTDQSGKKAPERKRRRKEGDHSAGHTNTDPPTVSEPEAT